MTFQSRDYLNSNFADRTIARLILQQFFSRDLQRGKRPKSWSANDKGFADRISHYLQVFGVAAPLNLLGIGTVMENTDSDFEWWKLLNNVPRYGPPDNLEEDGSLVDWAFFLRELQQHRHGLFYAYGAYFDLMNGCVPSLL